MIEDILQRTPETGSDTQSPPLANFSFVTMSDHAPVLSPLQRSSKSSHGDCLCRPASPDHSHRTSFYPFGAHWRQGLHASWFIQGCKSALGRVSADGFKVYRWRQPNEWSSHSCLMPFWNSGLAYGLGWLRWSLQLYHVARTSMLPLLRIFSMRTGSLTSACRRTSSPIGFAFH